MQMTTLADASAVGAFMGLQKVIVDYVSKTATMMRLGGMNEADAPNMGIGWWAVKELGNSNYILLSDEQFQALYKLKRSSGTVSA